jgi:hypothetical protein
MISSRSFVKKKGLINLISNEQLNEAVRVAFSEVVVGVNIIKS